MYISPIKSYYGSYALASGIKTSENTNFGCKVSIPPYSLEKFLQNFYRSGARKNLQGQCIEQNLLGKGANSEVYKFSAPSMSNWAIKIDYDKRNRVAPDFSAQLTRVEDEFPNINKGQVIAKIGDRISILKRIDAEPHSIKFWSTRRGEKNFDITKEEAEKFYDDVIKIASFPQESFNQYAGEMKEWHDKGYKLDSFNPNNFLINYKKKQIHIIDAYKYNGENRWNSRYDLICPLLDYANFEQILSKLPEEKHKSLIEAGRSIFYRCTRACQLMELPTAESNFTTFISKIDEREHNKNHYFESYQKLKSLLNI